MDPESQDAEPRANDDSPDPPLESFRKVVRDHRGVPRGGVGDGRITFRYLNLILPLVYSTVLIVKTIGS